MECGSSSQRVGFIGKTSYTLKYLENNKDLSSKWPRGNIFHECSPEKLLESIFNQDVGIDRSSAYREACDPLKVILGKFLISHGRTNYKELLQKCKTKSPNNQQQSTLRKIIKEYVHRIVFNVIPVPLFGTKSNAIQFERNFRKIIFLGKYQAFSLSMVLHGIQVKRISFLRSISDHNNKTNLFAKLFIWLLREYILTTLKCVFYVTESNFNYKYMFFEKQIWKKIQHRHMKKIKRQVVGTYKNCIMSGIVQKKHLYIVKLLPKRRGCRPVFLKIQKDDDWKRKCNLARKTVEVLISRVAGDYFKNVHSSWQVFHEKWLTLYEKWKSNSQPLVYFVRTDFTNAFASVNITKFLEIISKLRENNKDLLDLRFLFQGWLKNVSKVSIKSQEVPANSAFRIMELYVNKFFFAHYDKVYNLTGGLCQGGPLSCRLFDLYLGEWEKLFLSEYVEDENGLFIRNCDDCLYLTMNVDKALSYLRLVEEGFPEFNLFTNSHKTETNVRNFSKTTVSFCNYMLDVHCFQIYGNYKIYQNESFFHSSRLTSIESPGKIIFKRLRHPCMWRLRKVFLDPAYNTIDSILLNVFMIAGVSAAYCLAYMERLFSHFNEKFIMVCFVLCSRQIARVVHNSLQSDIDVNESMFQWIVIKAFLVRLNALKSKNFAGVMISMNGFLINLFKGMDVKYQEIISKFLRVQHPDLIKSLKSLK